MSDLTESQIEVVWGTKQAANAQSEVTRTHLQYQWYPLGSSESVNQSVMLGAVCVCPICL